VLPTRIVTALCALAVVAAALFLLPPLGAAVAVLGVLGAGAHEWARLARLATPAHVAFVVVFLALGLALVFVPAAGFAPAAHAPAEAARTGWPRAVVLAVCGVATLFWLLVATPWVVRRWPMRAPLALAAAGLVVLVGAFVAIVQLWSHSPWLLLAAMAIVWIADTAAYFTGRAFGRRKLAPLVSPGKTWEGLAGALIAVGLYALALVPLALRLGLAASLPGVLAWVVFAVAVAALSAVGDLFESWQKRQAGVKDSGRLLPGHGGVLDRIDALVAALPPLACATALMLSPAG
jgi:phosphatidate cytidylyltransferase